MPAAAAWRDALIDTSAALAIVVITITEVLSSFGALTRPSVLIAWTIIAAAAAGWSMRNGTRPSLIRKSRIPELTREDKSYLAFMAFVCVVTLFVALASPPNAPDASSYHVPRVLRWIQDGAVSFFPTHVQRQLWIGPGWEYFAVQLQLIAGMTTVTNLVQWLSMVAAPVVVSVIARELGAGRKGQLLAALFTVTIPMGIAQGSGSQVDMFASFWIVTSIALLLRTRRIGIENAGIRTAVLLGAAVGMSTASKATSVLFLMPFVLWIAWDLVRTSTLRFAGLGAIAVAVALMTNGPHLLRNQALYGSVLGISGSSGVVNSGFTPLGFASNIVRNAAIHLNTPSDRVNAQLTRVVNGMHEAVGISSSDPRTTFHGWKFGFLAKWADEGEGTNPFHFLVILATTLLLGIRRRKSTALKYLLCVLGGALLFALYLKWQPWHSRLHLPLFVVAGAAIGAALEKELSSKWVRWVALGLALTALRPTFRNSMRPLVVRQPLFTVPYEDRLIAAHEGVRQSRTYAAAADVIAARGCTRIGLIEDPMAWEFPIWKMIERRTGRIPEIRHVGVTNLSRNAASERERAFRPCAIMRTHLFVPPTREKIVMAQFFPEGSPQVPAGFEQAWKQQFITVYFPVGQ